MVFFPERTSREVAGCEFLPRVLWYKDVLSSTHSPPSISPNSYYALEVHKIR
ncbi:hypothetical protein OTSANNIE_0360 [Anaplasma phagocytophilum str. Annie]|nr:hypothetical protein OTSANNIE_0360 [Anaplasma phagocytophilum str. Annie]